IMNETKENKSNIQEEGKYGPKFDEGIDEEDILKLKKELQRIKELFDSMQGHYEGKDEQIELMDEFKEEEQGKVMMNVLNREDFRPTHEIIASICLENDNKKTREVLGKNREEEPDDLRTNKGR
ncbi:hypothetical protein KI387_040394, partial [Taxus chinensis]